jgi:hypothetical protein
MAIPALGLAEMLAMNAEQRQQYFFDYARYFEDSPLTPYAIRVGAKTLFAADTMDLRLKFEHWLATMSRECHLAKPKPKKPHRIA